MELHVVVMPIFIGIKLYYICETKSTYDLIVCIYKQVGDIIEPAKHHYFGISFYSLDNYFVFV